mmetsp:Transcript_13431/g.35480  ORF Transcript_13431/g.35480 Transcript_13431/m.35480 type:complete len:266 (+) Transcript_13431:141-938(+)
MVPEEGYDGPGRFVLAAPGHGKFASAPPVELTYFAIRGLGQLAQLCLEVAGHPYRYTVVTGPYFSEHLKPKLVFGRLPCVTAPDGTEIVQSKAVLRYVARLCGLGGKSDSEFARCDMLHELLQSEGKLDEAEIKKLEGRSSLGEVGDLKSTSLRATMDHSEAEKTCAALKFWEDAAGRSTTGWLLGGLGDGKAGGLCFVDLALYWTLRPHVAILDQLGCAALVKFVGAVRGQPGVARLVDSGRMMPDMRAGYLYQGDDLCPAPGA